MTADDEVHPYMEEIRPVVNRYEAIDPEPC